MSASSSNDAGANATVAPPKPAEVVELVSSGLNARVETWISFPPGYLPMGISISPNGKMMAVSVEGKREYSVHVYDPHSRTLLYSIGNGAGFKNGSFAEAQFDYAMGIDWSRDSNKIYVADYGNDCIREIRLDTQTVSTVSGSDEGFLDGTLATARYHCPTDVKVDPLSPISAPVLFVTEYYNHCVRCIDTAANSVTTILGRQVLNKSAHGREDLDPNGPPAFKLINPTGVTLRDGDGALFVCDYGNDRIVKYDRITREVRVVAGMTKCSGARDGSAATAQFRFPTCFCFIPKLNDIVLCDYGNHCVRLIQDIESEFASVSTLANVTKMRGKDDGDARWARLTFPRTPAVLPPQKLDHSTEELTIFIAEYRGAIRRLTIPFADTFAYFSRRSSRAHPMRLSHVLGEESFVDSSITLMDGAKRAFHSAVVRARCPTLFRAFRDTPEKIKWDQHTFECIMNYIYTDELPCMKFEENYRSNASKSTMVSLLRLIRVGKQFDWTELVENARAILGSFIIRHAADPQAQESIFKILQTLTSDLSLADEQMLLNDLCLKSSPTVSLFASKVTKHLRRDISTRMLDSKACMTLADVSILLYSSEKGQVLEEIRAHSVILCARSGYFRSLLGGKFGTNDQLTLECGPMVEGVSELEFLHEFVGILYGKTSYVPKSVQAALLLLDRLNFYGVDDSEAEIRAQRVILERLTAENCLQILKLVVDVPGLDLVRRQALWHVCLNLKTFYDELEHEKDQNLINKILFFKATFM